MQTHINHHLTHSSTMLKKTEIFWITYFYKKKEDYFTWNLKVQNKNMQRTLSSTMQSLAQIVCHPTKAYSTEKDMAGDELHHRSTFPFSLSLCKVQLYALIKTLRSHSVSIFFFFHVTIEMDCIGTSWKWRRAENSLDVKQQNQRTNCSNL